MKHPMIVDSEEKNSFARNPRSKIMAKAKAEINKSEVIRKIFADNPGATAKDVVAKLKAQGIEASEGLIYSCKPGKKKKKKGTKVNAKVGPASNGSVGESIATAKAAAEKVGGWSVLKEIVDALQ
jgi:hypothetical protein